jgi:hypothetical protein
MLADLLGVISSQELRVALEEHVGGPGQYDGAADNPNRFYLPLAGPSCRVVLTYRGNEIVALEPGSALNAGEWESLSEALEQSLVAGSQRVGRDFAFSMYRVLGSWRGARSGVQILPPPDDAPRAPYEMAEHPFILEFPIKESDRWPVTNHRRLRDHRHLAQLLDVLLCGHTNTLQRRPDHLWAGVSRDDGHTDIKWVQQFFMGNLGDVIRRDLSPPATDRLEEVEPEAYYERFGYDGRPLSVPADLDQSICLYLQLAPPNRAKFNRATFWLDIASRMWNISVSSSFTSLVTAIESLLEPATSHQVHCDKCDADRSHDVPGAGERLRAFFEQYAPGAALMSRRNKIYRLRGGIVHGGTLMQHDQDPIFGWDPPEWDERELHRDLWSVTKVALRNWLKSPPRS